MNVNVQFVDETQDVISCYFGCPQDESIYENLGEVGLDDPRWLAFYDSMPEYCREYLPAPVLN